MHITIKRAITLFTCGCILMTTLPGSALAAIIGTQAALSVQHRIERIDDINRWLVRDEVAIQLSTLGVEPEQAQRRVAVMTDAELQQLQHRIHDLPAGAGVLEVIGIVFVVLIILELLGVTNVFSRM